LISFWFGSEANASAGKKAFVTNRIGDFGFMLAIFLTFQALGTVTYRRGLREGRRPLLSPTTPLRSRHSSFSAPSASQAQIPACTSGCPTPWPGPTPVSALIHAATYGHVGRLLA
jgi:NADH-quinone oxidoreductase subunit L